LQLYLRKIDNPSVVYYYGIKEIMLPIPLLIVISIIGIVMLGIVVESLYVSARNLIQTYKKNRNTRKCESGIPTPNPMIEL